MTCKVIVRTEMYYGQITVYPVCGKALLFARIAGTKTLTPRVLNYIQDLGYEIENTETELAELNVMLNEESKNV